MASPLRSPASNTADAPALARVVSDPADRPPAAKQSPTTGPAPGAPDPATGRPSAWRAWAGRLPAWLQRQRRAPRAAGRHGATFTPSAGLQQRLVDQFDLRQDPLATPYPLLQAQGLIGLLQTRVLADLGVNRRHLRHFRHQTRLPQGARALNEAGRQRLECQLLRMVRISPGEMMALLQTRVTDDEGQLLALLQDSFVLSDLPPSDAAWVADDDLLGRAVSRDRRHEPAIDPAAEGVLRRQLFMAGHDSRRFGPVSGAHGLAREAPSRWPGRRQPVVQDLYLRNLVARELAEWGIEPVSLQITFCGQAHIGQTLCLRLQGQVFELVGPEGQLMAFGNVS